MIKERIDSLRNQGYRVTKTRKAIFEIFTTTKKPLSAEGLLALLVKKDLSPNKSTIYRELDFLEKEGSIKTLQLHSDRKMYEITTLGHHHHLVCLSCEAIEDLPMENHLENYEEKILEKNSFKVTRHSLEFFGICKSCQ